MMDHNVSDTCVASAAACDAGMAADQTLLGGMMMGMTASGVWNTALSATYYTVVAFLAYIVLALIYIAPRPNLWIKAFQVRNTKLNQRLPFMMWIPPVGDLIEQSRDYLGFYARRAAMGDKFGGFINWTMRHLLVCVHDPETARKFLAMDDLTFSRDFSIFWVVNQMAGKSILTADGEDWRSQHRMLYKAFSSENLVAFRPAFTHRANVLVKKLSAFAKTGEVVDIQPLLGDATLGVIMDCAFGDSLSADDRAELVDIFKYIVLETTNFTHQLPIINRLPGMGRYKLQRKLKRFREIADRAIEFRKTVSPLHTPAHCVMPIVVVVVVVVYPNAVAMLKQNLQDNKVADRCEVFEGDNRTFPLANIADRVNLGLIPTSKASWPVAVRVLRQDTGGWLHIHENVEYDKETEQKQAHELFAAHVARDIKSLLEARDVSTSLPPMPSSSAATTTPTTAQATPAPSEEIAAAPSSLSSWEVHVRHIECVKSYAPRVDHVVFDVECRPCHS
ncbi:hypothetical protein PTSG_03546 [Salpingoeca rosetta]|uniref:tRNA(Phe) (4-demethylwyosine(37)-C(7)) aminocarboxypropyltransferase n=1 Tax=Salpingoeca rosetta (strain ATCC 50818 / BSB-021) TaxID=946362 RepID=F2U5X3_SALR5|nr:uncharacterized protein PTSG_03546 [Salpingoeca rosetta]EGD82914.1 hypothetical protein PTSG_03546 [Salpingoeca rosetta]|eukprot:XP_004995278.1 hypothetical protein PTSG_03546 [Salpingoeca rosetta]